VSPPSSFLPLAKPLHHSQLFADIWETQEEQVAT
jgi:hypothetical protein